MTRAFGWLDRFIRSTWVSGFLSGLHVGVGVGAIGALVFVGWVARVACP